LINNLPNRLDDFTGTKSFEPSQTERRQQLAVKLFGQLRGNGTPFELDGMSRERCDSEEKAHRQNDDS
jgi:hypothetical protein